MENEKDIIVKLLSLVYEDFINARVITGHKFCFEHSKFGNLTFAFNVKYANGGDFNTDDLILVFTISEKKGKCDKWLIVGSKQKLQDYVYGLILNPDQILVEIINCYRLLFEYPRSSY